MLNCEKVVAQLILSGGEGVNSVGVVPLIVAKN